MGTGEFLLLPPIRPGPALPTIETAVFAHVDAALVDAALACSQHCYTPTYSHSLPSNFTPSSLGYNTSEKDIFMVYKNRCILGLRHTHRRTDY